MLPIIHDAFVMLGHFFLIFVPSFVLRQIYENDQMGKQLIIIATRTTFRFNIHKRKCRNIQICRKVKRNSNTECNHDGSNNCEENLKQTRK
jgi:hypothetical protein